MTQNTKRQSPLARRNKREGGVALMLSVLLLITVTGLAISTMQTAATDGTVAGFQKQELAAFYAAEAAVADAREIIRGFGDRSEVVNYPADFPNQANPVQLATTADFQTGVRPMYFADPLVVTAIGYVGEGARATEGFSLNTGRLQFTHTKWRIIVIGQSPSGDQKRIEIVATRLLPRMGSS